jgi:hypothetical protein
MSLIQSKVRPISGSVKYEQELRDIAERAIRVAQLIHQGGRGPWGFQPAANDELPTRNSELQGIEAQLSTVAAKIQSYLQRRGAG